MSSVRESWTHYCSVVHYSSYRKQCAVSDIIECRVAAVKSRQNTTVYQCFQYAQSRAEQRCQTLLRLKKHVREFALVWGFRKSIESSMDPRFPAVQDEEVTTSNYRIRRECIGGAKPDELGSVKVKFAALRQTP